MSKLHIKKGDTVKVIAGNSKGQEGKVIEVIISKSRALVEGVNMVSKHTKPNAASPQGGIIKKEDRVHHQVAVSFGFAKGKEDAKPEVETI